MGKIIFITSGKINYEFNGKTLYESIRSTAYGKKFPHIIKDSRQEVLEKARLLQKEKISIIFSATSNQCLDTTALLSDFFRVSFIKKKYLLPLKFELINLFSEKEFETFEENKYIELRRRFVENLFENKLVDNNSEIKTKFRTLIDDAQKYKNVLAVSHAYLIKLFYIYYEIGDKMFADKDLLIKMFDPKIEPMKRLETLEIHF